MVTEAFISLEYPTFVNLQLATILLIIMLFLRNLTRKSL